MKAADLKKLGLKCHGCKNQRELNGEAKISRGEWTRSRHDKGDTKNNKT